jgi:sugar phosphate isomerase/epimerase
MENKRRTFIKKSSTLVAGGLLLGNWACSQPAESTEQNENDNSATPEPTGEKLGKYGIQLYTLRDVMPENPTATLEQIAQMGYQQIEGYEGPQGMFWNHTPAEFKKKLDDLGLAMIASHCDINKDFERKAAEAAEVGMKYLICPWLNAPKTLDEWKQHADLFNKSGEICKANGLRFAYHNHDYPFYPIDGTIPMDFVLEQTDPDLVDFEMDIYWVVTAQADPIAYFEKYPGRFRMCHVKDRKKGATAEEKEASCDLGKGGIDFPSILSAARDNGTEYFFLEQEEYGNSTPLECSKVGAAYLDQLVLS